MMLGCDLRYYPDTILFVLLSPILHPFISATSCERSPSLYQLSHPYRSRDSVYEQLGRYKLCQNLDSVEPCPESQPSLTPEYRRATALLCILCRTSNIRRFRARSQQVNHVQVTILLKSKQLHRYVWPLAIKSLQVPEVLTRLEYFK